jgi:superfamily II DNA or RNA helicase
MRFAYISGQDSSARRRKVIDQYKAGRINVLIASTIVDEGFDAPATEFLVLAGGGKAEHRQVQRIGRGMRVSGGKERLTVVDFMDRGRWLGAHARQRLRGYLGERSYTVVELPMHELRDILGADAEEL